MPIRTRHADFIETLSLGPRSITRKFLERELLRP